jgi:arylsulfatase A-like enzyme
LSKNRYRHHKRQKPSFLSRSEEPKLPDFPDPQNSKSKRLEFEMDKWRFAWWLVLGVVVLPAGLQFAVQGPVQGAAPDRHPNFVVIFCDDMGYADIGPFGAQGYTTPNLDRMAAQGMKFTDFYAGRSFCSPSRAALMTGCIPTRVGVGGNFAPRSTTGLHPEETTVAEVLKQTGYATACFGKWHLGHLPQFLPTNQGFDEFFGLPYSNDMWPFHPEVSHLEMEQRLKRWPHLPLYEGKEIINAQVMAEDQVTLTRQLTERAVRFIEQHAHEPFFLYLPNPQPHVPLFASGDFVGKTTRGLFGDVLTEIDWQVGQLLATIQQLQLDEQTCIVFTSDNGPWLSYGEHAGSAGKLREGKGTNFEGGFRVPCVMRWPGVIPPGQICAEVVGTMDLLPTFASLAGAQLPERKIDGRDIGPLMRGEAGATSPHEVFFHYDGSNRLVAVRSGPWKLMFPQDYSSAQPGTGGHPGRGVKRSIELSLFHLTDDIGETTNLVDKHPEVVARLLEQAALMRLDLGDGSEYPGSGRRPLGG